MAYSDYAQTDGYTSKASGAWFSLVLIDINAPESPVLDAMGGINWSENTPVSAVEEAGEDRVNEFVDERYTGQGNCSFFYTAERNDKLPTVETFLGREYMLVQRIAPERPGAGTVVNAWEGLKITGLQSSHGARGLVNGSFSYQAVKRYNGQEYAAAFGA